MTNIKKTGQVFTPLNIVKKMIKLVTIKPNSVLEPSSGTGRFFFELIKHFDNVTAIELDETIAHKGSIRGDFFDDKEKYDLIIGNPPYVDYKEIVRKPFDTKLNHKPNLYIMFLERSLKKLNKDGEIVFIIPTTWLTATSSKSLIVEIFNNYSIQHFEVIPENVWENASVTTAIVKIKKGTNHSKIDYYMSKNNKIIMGKRPNINLKGDITINVGGASGNNTLYKKKYKDSTNFVISSTERTGELQPMRYYPVVKDWVRKVPNPPKKFKYQIFVNMKTRKKEPFYTLEQKSGEPILFDGGVLSIYCDFSKKDTQELKNTLNKLNWEKMGVYTNGRFHFTQSLLKSVLLG